MDLAGDSTYPDNCSFHCVTENLFHGHDVSANVTKRELFARAVPHTPFVRDGVVIVFALKFDLKASDVDSLVLFFCVLSSLQNSICYGVHILFFLYVYWNMYKKVLIIVNGTNC